MWKIFDISIMFVIIVCNSLPDKVKTLSKYEAVVYSFNESFLDYHINECYGCKHQDCINVYVMD